MTEDLAAGSSRPKCPVCGHVGEPFSRYCSRCGSVLAAGAGDDETGAMPRLVIDGPGATGGPPTGDLPAVPVAPRSAALVVRKGPDVGFTFELGDGVVHVGRAAEADLFLDDVTVSRRHAQIAGSGGVWTVTDTGSLNGTYVNRSRIDEPHQLRPNDELQIGKYRFAFVMGERE